MIVKNKNKHDLHVFYAYIDTQETYTCPMQFCWAVILSLGLHNEGWLVQQFPDDRLASRLCARAGCSGPCVSVGCNKSPASSPACTGVHPHVPPIDIWGCGL